MADYPEEQGQAISMMDQLGPGMPMPSPAAPSIPALPMPQVSPGLAMASGLQSALAGKQANPYLQGQQAQENVNVQQNMEMMNQARLQQQAQQQQQIQMMQMAQKTKEFQAQEKLRRQEASFKVVDHLLKEGNSYDAKMAGAQGLYKMSEDIGLKIDPQLFKGLAVGAITDTKLKSAARYQELGMDPEKIQELTGVTPALLDNIQKNKNSDAYSMMVFGKTQTELAKENLSLASAQRTFKEGDMPGWNTPAGIEARLISAHVFGKPAEEISKEDWANAYEAGQKKVTAREAEKEGRALDNKLVIEKYKADRKAEQALVGKDKTLLETAVSHPNVQFINNKGELYNGPMGITGTEAEKLGYQPTPKTLVDQIQATKGSFQIFSNMRGQAAKMAQNGTLVAAQQLSNEAFAEAAKSNPGLMDAVAAEQPGALERLSGLAKFYASKKTQDKDVLIWLGMESEMIIALRALGEKGMRAVQAFEGAMGTMKSGQYAVIDGYLRNLELTGAGNIDAKYRNAFNTRYAFQELDAKGQPTGRHGRMTLKPGEAIDLKKYRIEPEFAAPPRPQGAQ